MLEQLVNCFPKTFNGNCYIHKKKDYLDERSIIIIPDPSSPFSSSSSTYWARGRGGEGGEGGGEGGGGGRGGRIVVHPKHV